jgi:tRNA (cmo5U34)-methyltransferase
MRNDHHNHGVMEAGGYDKIISTVVPHQQELIRIALAYLPPNPADILELGCGTGILTGKLLDACPGAAVTGLDISDEMLDIARNKPGLCGASFITRDIRRAWPGRGYDAIVSSLCLHHLSPREREKVLHRAARALRPGGRFICGDIFRAEHDWEERLLTGAWERAMRDTGAGENVISGMLAQRSHRLPELSTIPRFRKQCASAGFPRVHVPYIAGFLGLVIGFAPSEKTSRT